jgi:RNA polymerase sigma-70 factor, ECF subfamily
MDRDPRIDRIWHDERAGLVGVAARMLGDRGAAEDVVQEAFARLVRIPLDEVHDPRAWLVTVVRRLSLNRLRSAYSRRESAAGAAPPGDAVPSIGAGPGPADPADRVTLDDQVQLALAVVLDRLTPAERTAFVLHDVFAFSYAAIAEVVGRTPAACRQLASRARRSIRAAADTPPPTVASTTSEHRAVAERFIAACSGGDLAGLMALLDPDVVGDATLVGHGPRVRLAGRLPVASRLLELFGPESGATLVPVEVERTPGVVVLGAGHARAVFSLEAPDGLVRHIRSFITRPARGATPR